jgi:hypothetical protein
VDEDPRYNKTKLVAKSINISQALEESCFSENTAHEAPRTTGKIGRWVSSQGNATFSNKSKDFGTRNPRAGQFSSMNLIKKSMRDLDRCADDDVII